MNTEVVVVIGAGGIGLAIARRQGPGKTLLLADFNQQTLDAAAAELTGLGHRVTTQTVDVSSRESVHALARKAAELGAVTQLVQAAGLSPAMAPPAAVLKVDLYGTALVVRRVRRGHRPRRVGDRHLQHGRLPAAAAARRAGAGAGHRTGGGAAGPAVPHPRAHPQLGAGLRVLQTGRTTCGFRASPLAGRTRVPAPTRSAPASS